MCLLQEEEGMGNKKHFSFVFLKFCYECGFITKYWYFLSLLKKAFKMIILEKNTAESSPALNSSTPPSSGGEKQFDFGSSAQLDIHRELSLTLVVVKV